MVWYHTKGAAAGNILMREPVAPPKIERPKPVTNTHVTSIPSRYAEIAREIGFCPGPLFHREVINFLREQQIPTYNYNSVEAYMTKLAVAEKANFFWRPLRPKDQVIFGTYHWGFGQAHGYYNAQDKVCAPYDKLVPIHILTDVKTIQDRFGDEVAFFVSDYKANSPDPFILVTAPREGMPAIVFGAWDEPGFDVI